MTCEPGTDTIQELQFLLALVLAAEAPTTLLVPPFKHTLGFNRIGRFYVELYLGRNFRIDDPQGMCGAKMVEEDDPTTGRDDHILTLFAVNSGTGQVVYNVKLIEPRVYGTTGPDTGQFDRPRGICCNPEGDVYIADTGNDRVVRLRYAEGTLDWVSVVGTGLSAPSDVSMDSRDRLYVADRGNDRVVVHDPDGTLDAEWTGVLEGPSAIAVLDRNADFNEYGLHCAVVVDRDGTRINQLSLTGQVRRRVDMRRIGLDEARFAYVAFDRHGNCYVTDAVNSQVHVFDQDLKYVVSYGGPDELDSPRGIVIWRRFGQLFLNEAEGGHYYWLGLDAYLIGCYPPSFNSRRPGTTIALYVTEVADVTVEIADGRGARVRDLTPPHVQRPGEVLVVWDGLDNDGNLVPEGEYRVKAVVRPTYSKPKYTFKKELTGRVWRVADN